VADPFPKERQLARGERRYRRKVANPKKWQAIIAAKGEACRICESWGTVSVFPIEYHHLVPRAHLGDDVADNIVPLCSADHRLVTEGQPSALARLAANLSPAEQAYVVGKLGEGGMERLFGVAR
jgi:predicted HNH restriction endonuclease